MPSALLTGCASGIGRHLIGVLSGAGYRLTATHRSLERLRAVAAEDRWPESIRLAEIDVRSPDDVIVFELDTQSNDRKRRQLSDIRCERVFAAHPGWAGYIERGSV